ncbi:hypothetical protein [[Eubacterium] cellulosolvens]
MSAPTSGEMVYNNDWYIGANKEISISNQIIILNGNLVINATGTLILDAVTLILNNTLSNQFDIIVKDNGRLSVSNSTIKSTPVAACSKIVFNHGSNGSLKNIRIPTLGCTTSSISGVFLDSSNVILDNCSISNSTYAVFVNHSSPAMIEVSLANCKFGIFGRDTHSYIKDCTVANCNTSIQLLNGSNITAVDSVIPEPKLYDTSKLILKKILPIQVIFSKPYIKPVENSDILLKNEDKTLYSTQKYGGTDEQTNGTGRIEPLTVIQKIYSGQKITDCSTSISVNYKSRAKINNIINFSSPQPGQIIFENYEPILNYPNVNPWSGAPGETYSFSILYMDLDNDPPVKMDVEIDGQNYQMVTETNNKDWRNGSWFHYNKTLPVGEHCFKFIVNDGLGFPDIYYPSGGASNISGPSVAHKNSEPILTDGSVSPATGDENTVFRYKIKYSDAELDAPMIAKVFIDNLPHDMTECPPDEVGGNGNDQSQNIWFEFTTRLNVGAHTFFFKFKDDNGSEVVRWPVEGQAGEVIDGPMVVDFENTPPQVGNGTVTPAIGHRLIRFSYTISYYDLEGDIPTVAWIIIDGIPFNLTRARIAQHIYFYETLLPLGQHFFHFEFWDALNEHFVRYPAEADVEILGPIVLDLPPVLGVGNVTPNLGTPEDMFDFSMLYSDPENDWPVLAAVVIDNQSFNLSIRDYSQVNGSEENTDDERQVLVLSYSTQLPIGDHNFFFVVQSGEYILRYPGTGYLTGPTVVLTTNTKPDQEPDDTQDVPEQNYTGQETTTDNDTAAATQENGTRKDQKVLEPLNKFEVLSYGINEFDGSSKNEYIFVINCVIPTEILKDVMCWVYINEESYLMNMKKTSEDNLTRFSLMIILAPGEHYYHFLFKLGDSMVRYPHLGEFRGPVIVDNEITQETTERINENQDYRDIQVMAILILLLSFIVFSIYYTYFAPKKGIR